MSLVSNFVPIVSHQLPTFLKNDARKKIYSEIPLSLRRYAGYVHMLTIYIVTSFIYVDHFPLYLNSAFCQLEVFEALSPACIVYIFT